VSAGKLIHTQNSLRPSEVTNRPIVHKFCQSEDRGRRLRFFFSTGAKRLGVGTKPRYTAVLRVAARWVVARSPPAGGPWVLHPEHSSTTSLEMQVELSPE